MHRTWVKVTAVVLAALMAFSGLTAGVFAFIH